MNKDVLDVSKIFTTYMAFCGNVEKTALTLDLDVKTVRDLENAEHWKQKVEAQAKIQEGDARETQILINRTINYVQAHRLRKLLDDIIAHFAEEGPEALIEKLTTTTKHGSEFKTRAITDLVKAAEAVQLMTQRALGDTAAERPEPEAGGKEASMALLVQRAMNAADEKGLSSTQVVQKHLAQENEPPRIAGVASQGAS